MSQEDSCYSNDQQYFLDLCRSGDLQELKQFVQSLDEKSQFNWVWFSNSQDNFVHMLAANNFPQIFSYLLPKLKDKCPDQIPQIFNKQNSSANTPLHYAVITDSKQMVSSLIQAGVNTQITNEHGRTAFEEAQKFGKFEIAQILAPVTKMDSEQIEKLVSDLKLNDDDSSSDEEEEEKKQQKMVQKQEEIQKKQDKIETTQEIKQQKQIKE